MGVVVGWNFWFTLNWVHDFGGSRVLAGELLLIAGFSVWLFGFLTREFPLLGWVVAPGLFVLGVTLLGWGLRAHAAAGLSWTDWDWEGTERPHNWW